MTRRRGREKLHFLNPIPIRLVRDRWVSKTPPERLWEAITNPEMRRKYTFGVGVYSDWNQGSSYRAETGSETISPH